MAVAELLVGFTGTPTAVQLTSPTTGFREHAEATDDRTRLPAVVGMGHFPTIGVEPVAELFISFRQALA
jgi:hypothetical protein